MFSLSNQNISKKALLTEHKEILSNHYCRITVWTKYCLHIKVTRIVQSDVFIVWFPTSESSPSDSNMSAVVLIVLPVRKNNQTNQSFLGGIRNGAVIILRQSQKNSNDK